MIAPIEIIASSENITLMKNIFHQVRIYTHLHTSMYTYIAFDGAGIIVRKRMPVAMAMATNIFPKHTSKTYLSKRPFNFVFIIFIILLFIVKNFC